MRTAAAHALVDKDIGIWRALGAPPHALAARIRVSGILEPRMIRVRRSPSDLTKDALGALRVALEDADITVGGEGPGPWSFDAAVDILVDDRPFTVAVEVKAYCTGSTAREAINRLGPPQLGMVPMVVAERITSEAKQLLSEAGWSWLDRRGRLHLRGPAVRVDVDVPTSGGVEAPPPGPAIAGRSGLTVAYWLLDHPQEALSPTGHAPELRLAPSTISTSVRRLAETGLLDDDRRALVPELFWELAASWRAERSWVAAEPDPSRHRSPDPEAPTWRRGGSAAAAAWSAPIVTSEGGPLELYVPGPVEVSIAQRRYGASEPGSGAAVLTVAPASPVVAGTAARVVPHVGGWPAAPKLAVALDLAQDQARGRQILEEWNDVDAVWR